MSDQSRQRLIPTAGAAAAALMLIIVPRHEGTVLKGYRDPVGIVTSCSGHTGPGAVLGREYTVDECATQLDGDLLTANADITRCVQVPLAPHERAAYASFALNVGGARFCASTLVRKLNAGDHAGACAELSRWVNAGGKPLPGLVTRRANERALCEGRWRPTP